MKVSFALKTLPNAYKEAVAMHEFLRRAGFEPTDISIHYNEGKIGVILEAQSLDFYLEVGELENTFDEFEDTWKQISFALMSYQVNEVELEEVWLESVVYNNRKQLLGVLNDIGFEIPPKEEKINNQLN